MDYTNTILSGIIVLKLGKKYIYVNPFSAEDKTFADFFSKEQYDDAIIDGIWTQEEAEKHLINEGYLDSNSDDQIEDITEKIENMKVDYFNHFYNSETKKYIKLNIKKQEDRILEIYQKKNLFYDKTCEYLKRYSFLSYLLQKNAYLEDGNLACDYYSIQGIYNKYIATSNKIGSKTRSIANTNEWKNRWYSLKTGAFENKPSSFTELQISVISWSTYYESICQSPDKPSDDIIEDDIALDGWSIKEKRTRKEEEKKKNAEKMLPKNMKNAGEIFIPATNRKQAEDIMSLNNMQAKAQIKSLRKDLNEHGTINDSDLTNTRQELQMQSIRMQKENRRK